MTISVVIPMYNAENTILTALNSIKNQTYKCNYQIIIVNDGSKDASKTIVENYIIRNPQMNITLVDQANGGVSKARNEGLRRAKGGYIALLDSDDEWLPKKIEKQMSIFEKNSDIDLLGTNRNNEHFKIFLGFKFNYLTKISSKLLLLKTFLVTPSVIFKKKILDNTGFFDEQQKFAEEGDYWIRICNKNNCYLVNESLVITGGGKPNFGFSGLSSNLWQMEKGELKNMKTALNLKIINIFEYFFLVIYSIAKFIRRLIIVKLRK